MFNPHTKKDFSFSFAILKQHSKWQNIYSLYIEKEVAISNKVWPNGAAWVDSSISEDMKDEATKQ